ncbi:CapA family protein [Actinomadura parmotrematis]|uniref:CapA family protein n=1 Tax=Actinomadura parmotrematis TaxID=2864039 RepID=A0ABS7FRC8_9ACTN|nr:CapA family protein [Actinomadura parmotrematis]MBW8482953.1 CapA family protein [Actinomadura parmotrematis]
MALRGKAAAVVAVSGLLAVTAACGGGGGGDSEAKGQASPDATASTARQEAPPAADKRPALIAFAGDTHFEGPLRARLASPKTALGPIAGTLRSADLTMLNLETAITTGGTPAPAKQFTFRAPPSAFTALKAAGVDVVSMANNHGMDYMEGGLRDSLKAIEKSGFPVVGIGANADEAYKARRFTVKGNRIAIVGATQVLDDHLIEAWTATDSKGGLASAKDEARMVRAVKDAGEGSDVVIVHLHWGQELKSCPLPRQQALARKLIEAGADAVIGGHAHIPLGGGYLDGAYVDYGMGNFVFSSASGQTANSGVLLLRVQDGKVTAGKWKPARISGGLPRLMTGAAASAELKRWNGLRSCTGLAARPE